MNKTRNKIKILKYNFENEKHKMNKLNISQDVNGTKMKKIRFYKI